MKPVETKVAVSSLAALAVTALFACASFYHWFTPPPPYLTGLLITAVTGAAGWLAPHTSRPPMKVFTNLAPVTQAEIDRMRDTLEGLGMLKPPSGRASASPPPAVQPPATTTGPAT